MTEREMRQFMVEAEREFLSLLRGFGAETSEQKLVHESLLSGFKDGMMTMARWASDHGMLEGKPAKEPTLVRTTHEILSMAKAGR